MILLCILCGRSKTALTSRKLILISSLLAFLSLFICHQLDDNNNISCNDNILESSTVLKNRPLVLHAFPTVSCILFTSCHHDGTIRVSLCLSHLTLFPDVGRSFSNTHLVLAWSLPLFLVSKRFNVENLCSWLVACYDQLVFPHLVHESERKCIYMKYRRNVLKH